MMGKANLLKRGTLLIPSGPENDPDRMHLHIICTDPDENGHQLVVPICSAEEYFNDPVCVLQKHEHEFLKHDSFPAYGKAQKVLNSHLANGIKRELFDPWPDVNPQVFLKVTKGITKSIHTKPSIKKYFLNSIEDGPPQAPANDPELV